MMVAAAPLLDTETFSASSSRDALGRVLTAVSPDTSTVSYTYDEGGGLRRVDLEHRGGQTTQTVVGKITYNARGQREQVIYATTTTTYGPLRRPVDRTVSVSGGPTKLLGRVVYGELLDNPAATNHRGRVHRAYDGAGRATTIAFGFEGHPLLEQRQLFADPKAQPDWSPLLGQSTLDEMMVAAAPLLDPETFSASSSRDALGRVLTAVSPDTSTVSYTYDEGGGLRRVDLEHRGGQTTETVVGEITYNARGQREQVVYGAANSPTTTTQIRSLHTHTHPAKVDLHPTDPTKGRTTLFEPREVTLEEVFNIMFGRATRSRPRGR